MLARRQHGDNSVGVLHRVRDIGSLAATACAGPRERLAREIESGDGVARLDEVGGHGAAHIAEADECDVGHSFFPEGGVHPLRRASCLRSSGF